MAGDFLIDSLITKLALGMTTDGTASSFSALIPTVTEPAPSATRSVVAFPQTSVKQKANLRVLPFGTGSDDNTLSIKVVGWDRVINNNSNANKPQLYISQTICEVLCTLSTTMVGLSGQLLDGSHYLSDVLSLTTGVALLHQGTSNIDNAWIVVDTSPFEWVEIVGKTGTASAYNWFYGF